MLYFHFFLLGPLVYLNSGWTAFLCFSQVCCRGLEPLWARLSFSSCSPRHVRGPPSAHPPFSLESGLGPGWGFMLQPAAHMLGRAAQLFPSPLTREPQRGLGAPPACESQTPWPERRASRSSRASFSVDVGCGTLCFAVFIINVISFAVSSRSLSEFLICSFSGLLW